MTIKRAGLKKVNFPIPFKRKDSFHGIRKIDFLFYDVISLQTVIKDQAINLKVTNVKGKIGGEKDGLEYLLFAKDKTGEKLQTFVNKRLKELKKAGILKKLSQQYLAGDRVSHLPY